VTRRRIIIVGGGLAGLTLGILLRRQDIPVEIWEAGVYPRHRVCGEFISGTGLPLLHRLGVQRDLPGFSAKSVRFVSERGATNLIELPEAAWSVSRFELDHALACMFRESGGKLFENRRWTNGFAGEGLVRASGRRLRTPAEVPRYNGLKVHAHNLPLSADLELHFSRSGYVGLAKLSDGRVNICGIFSAERKLKDAGLGGRKVFEESVFGRTFENLRDAELDHSSLSAVAGISLERESSNSGNECRLGDSICMISPLTGNGMSLAIESAHIAAPPLVQFSDGKFDWITTRDRISQKCDKTFARRLKVSSILQKILFTAAGRSVMLSSFRAMPSLIKLCFHGTR
jgi:flavin-dependent dehydrogenase